GDAANVPASLVAACIEDAHEQIRRFLDPRHDTEAPAGALVIGETFLAGAGVLRALAAKEAVDQKRLTIGGQRIEESQRFQTLTAAAATATDQAWTHLEPYLLERPVLAPVDATDTAPVLGEG
ncbi:MAG: hypothetical protein RBU21_24110, partial [FCB group bacterium]|nr:hypothetical protein [FCB group bacterium]